MVRRNSAVLQIQRKWMSLNLTPSGPPSPPRIKKTKQKKQLKMEHTKRRTNSEFNLNQELQSERKTPTKQKTRVGVVLTPILGHILCQPAGAKAIAKETE